MKFSRWLLFLFDLLIIGLAIISTYLYFIAPSMVYDRNSLALVAWMKSGNARPCGRIRLTKRLTPQPSPSPALAWRLRRRITLRVLSGEGYVCVKCGGGIQP